MFQKRLLHGKELYQLKFGSPIITNFAFLRAREQNSSSFVKFLYYFTFVSVEVKTFISYAPLELLICLLVFEIINCRYNKSSNDCFHLAGGFAMHIGPQIFGYSISCQIKGLLSYSENLGLISRHQQVHSQLGQQGIPHLFLYYLR